MAQRELPTAAMARATLRLGQVLDDARRYWGDRLAVVDGDQRFVWRQTADRAMRLAGALRAAGVQPGDRVAMLSVNSHRYIEFFLAVPRVGGVLTPLNTRLSSVELTRVLNDCGAMVLIVDDANRQMAEAIVGECPLVTTVLFGGGGAPPSGFEDYERTLASAEPCEDSGRGGDDLAALIYTSGSTGTPKGVMLSHANLILGALSFIGPARLTRESVAMLSSPLFHVGATALAIPAIMLGATMVTVPRFVPPAVAAAIEKNRVSVMTAVPTTLRMLLDAAAEERRDLTSLETVIYGGSPMPEALQQEAAKGFAGARLIQGYGMTELTACLTILDDAYVSRRRDLGKFRSVGHALPCCEIAIAGPDDAPLPPDAVGEVLARGPIMMQGYWNSPDLSAETLRGGWMHTGDLGYLDKDGFLYLVGRSKDMIITGGENVYPSEVEEIILEMATVRQCAVVGVPHSLWGEAVTAVIVTADGAALDQDAVLAHCRKHLAGYKCPRTIHFQDEPLPTGGANKTDRAAVKAALAAKASQDG